MKYLICFSLGLIVGGVTLSQVRAGENPAPAVGRYQISEGSYTAVDADGTGRVTHEVRGLFRLDTATGELSRFDITNYQGKLHVRWYSLATENQ